MYGRHAIVNARAIRQAQSFCGFCDVYGLCICGIVFFALFDQKNISFDIFLMIFLLFPLKGNKKRSWKPLEAIFRKAAGCYLEIRLQKRQ